MLQTSTFAYNASNRLTKVTDNDSKNVQYEYATDSGAAGSQFITKITDKMGRVTSAAWTFTANGTRKESSRIDLTRADGLLLRFDRSVSTSVCTFTRRSMALFCRLSIRVGDR